VFGKRGNKPGSGHHGFPLGSSTFFVAFWFSSGFRPFDAVNLSLKGTFGYKKRIIFITILETFKEKLH